MYMYARIPVCYKLAGSVAEGSSVSCWLSQEATPHMMSWKRYKWCTSIPNTPKGTLYFHCWSVHLGVQAQLCRASPRFLASKIRNVITPLPDPHVWIHLCSSKPAPTRWMMPLQIYAHLNGGGFGWRGACATWGSHTLSPTNLCNAVPLLSSSSSFRTLLLGMTM